MTIYEIDNEIHRLNKLKQEMQKEEAISNYKDYIGKYYKSEFCIGKIFVTRQNEIKVKELYFDDDSYEILNNIEEFDVSEIQEIISKEKFEEILDGWVVEIKNVYELQTKQNR